MKKRFFVGLIFTLLILITFAGCATKCPDNWGSGLPLPPPPPDEENWVPLTITVLRQVLNNNNNDLDGTLRAMHFRISHKIELERQYTDLELRQLGGAVYRDITDHRNPISFAQDQYGVGLAGRSVGSGWQERFFLSVGFNKEDQRLQLQFSNIGDHRDELIYLDYTPIENKSVMGKGTLYYGPDDDRHLYTVKYDGNSTPYLKIDLRESRSERVDPRPVPGLRFEDLQ